MPNQSIEYSQNRKNPTKKAMNGQDRASFARSRCSAARSAFGRLAVSAASLSKDAVAMEDFLDRAEIGGKGRALLHLQVPRPWQVDVDDLVDPSRPRRDDADLARQLDRLLDAMGDEHHGRTPLEPQRLQIDANALPRHRIELAQRLVEQQRVRLMHQRLAERRALLHAA